MYAIVGYGNTSTGAVAQKRVGVVERILTHIAPPSLTDPTIPNGAYMVSVPGPFNQMACEGDSGGPVIDSAGDVLAVMSRVLPNTGTCGTYTHLSATLLTNTNKTWLNANIPAFCCGQEDESCSSDDECCDALQCEAEPGHPFKGFCRPSGSTSATTVSSTSTSSTGGGGSGGSRSSSTGGSSSSSTGGSSGGGSCVGHCDANAGDCWCDSLCVSYGDCCPDACSVCGQCP